MSLRLYNTLKKAEEEFVPVKPPNVTLYTCGPTVYGRAHIGNFSSYLMADLLKRWLMASGYSVNHVMNITDVGHLVADRDSGEDKIEKKAREEFGSVTHETVLKVARSYEEQFVADRDLLNIIPPNHQPRASEYVPQMKAMIEELMRKGIAYITEDGIYYDITKFPHYGELSGNTMEDVKSGARIEVREGKRHPADFALWKFCVGQNLHHALRWESPKDPSGTVTPDGFPGWHIECSAMSRSLLGDQIDLHTGGEDNIFPHHECEIAQSEAVTGKSPFVRFWVHKRRIDLAGEKMSKSKGNILTVSDIVGRGFSPLDLRYLLLSVHYRTNLKFSFDALEEAHMARRTIVEWIMRDGGGEFAPIVKAGDSLPTPDTGKILAFKQKFIDAMNSDLNTPAALAAIFSCIHYMNTKVSPDSEQRRVLKDFIGFICDVFGCFEPEDEGIPAEVQALCIERDRARAKKDFAESDRLRDEIAKRGFTVKDTPEGTRVRRK